MDIIHGSGVIVAARYNSVLHNNTPFQTISFYFAAKCAPTYRHSPTQKEVCKCLSFLKSFCF